jgi:hypothetical protein
MRGTAERARTRWTAWWRKMGGGAAGRRRVLWVAPLIESARGEERRREWGRRGALILPEWVGAQGGPGARSTECRRRGQRRASRRSEVTCVRCMAAKEQTDRWAACGVWSWRVGLIYLKFNLIPKLIQHWFSPRASFQGSKNSNKNTGQLDLKWWTTFVIISSSN